MIRVLKAGCVAFLILLQAAQASAASIGDSFTISALIGDDTTAPTIPSPVTAVPMASTQIDVAWGTSTDDTVVAGYQLFRDSVQIATTTLTSYSDTGLTASTTYTYTVVAFDIFNNFSSSSAPISTTTFALPPPTPVATSSDSGSQATRVPLELVSFKVEAGTESAVVSFETSIPVRFTLRYGQGSLYSDGILQGGLFSKEHETLVSNLRPGTSYEFELTGTDRFGRAVVLKRGAFKTMAEPDTVGPQNVSNFVARASGNDVLLSWDEPTYPDFAYVRVVRSHLFFPADPNDGIVVFEGRASEYVDDSALTDNGTQYYTIFAYDNSSQRSSGAIALARRVGETGPTPGQIPAAGSSTPPIKITLADIEVVQQGQTMRLSERHFKLNNNAPFTLRVPYGLFPRHLKVITVTLALPDDPNRVFSFLLRATEDFAYYEAALAPLSLPGNYGFSFSVFDVKTNHIFELSGILPVEGDEESVTVMEDAKESAFPFWLLLLGLLGLAILFFMLFRRRRNEYDEDNAAVEKP